MRIFDSCSGVLDVPWVLQRMTGPASLWYSTNSDEIAVHEEAKQLRVSRIRLDSATLD